MAKRADQPGMFEERPPAREGNRLFCHEEFLEKMEENRGNTVGRRAALLLQRLLVDVRRQHYKPTQGVNRGWRRSALGGSKGYHFYAWWAPRGAAPLKENGEFEDAPEGSVFLRAIRHHDDHHPLNAQSVVQNYLPIGVRELREEFVPSPWTQMQARFAEGRQKVRIIKGFPGSGKTTALWNAADRAGWRRVLYVTYSAELAALARDHFDKFVPEDKRFEVMTYAQLLRKLLGSDQPFEPVRQTRANFVKAVSGFSTTILGPWANDKGALYDEMHAHLFGATLPFAIGRFLAFPDRRVSARQYRDLRERAIGRVAAEAVVEVCETLRRRDSRTVEQRFFRELDLAWQAVHELRARGAGEWGGFDCIAIDEAQDLTPIEALALVEMATRMSVGSSTFLIAGDEAQTVRPTDFEWGWFQDLVHFRMTSPAEFKLQINLRSPRRIATLVNRIWDLYGNISKSERPGGTGIAEIDENAGDQTVWCAARTGPELDQLLEVFAQREGLAIIVLGEEIPAYIPAALRDRVLTTFEAKGLDFQSVCILDAGRWLERVLRSRERGRGLELDDLNKRLAIDQLRVAVSRPSERLYWVDVSPSEHVFQVSQHFLTFGNERTYPVVPPVLIQSLEEEALDLEERVRLCESDARQYLEVKPALAWSRARQAVALLGEPGGKFSVTDDAARKSAYLTACQVAFTLAVRNVKLPQEMGRLDLYLEAARSAVSAGDTITGLVIDSFADYVRSPEGESGAAILGLADHLQKARTGLEPWLLLEMQPHSDRWIAMLEHAVVALPGEIARVLPPVYRLFRPQRAEELTAALGDKVIRALMRLGDYRVALELLAKQSSPDATLVAQCHEGLGDLPKAAESYLAADNPKEALRCYRSIPDFEKTLELLEKVENHPAQESLHWLREMRYLASRRPAEFQKVILPEEKRLLEQVLETALGATRKKPGAKKTATKTAAAKKAPAAKKKTPAAPRKKKEYF